MDVRCRIELFGELRAVQGDQTHTRFRTHKAGLLLAYLALNLHRTQARERLLDTFWGDMEPQMARDNLSTTLSQLRRQLETTGIPTGSILVADRQQVRLNADAVSVDAGDFDRLTRQAKVVEDAPAKTALLQEAANLYRGELLPGCYEEWATREQTRFQSAYLECLRHLTRNLETAGHWPEALEYAQKATAADPYAEEFYQAQMRLLVRLKRPAVALQTYEELALLFERDLGAQPAAGTRQMAEMIRSDPRAAALIRAEAAKPSVSSPAVSVPAAPTSGVSASLLPTDREAAPHPTPAPTIPLLPLQLTRFFGREQEREQIAALLQTPDVRLISLLGPGGAGKTRLSVEVAAHVMALPDSRFATRVWFVSLADVPDAGLIPAALVNALRLPPDARADPLDRIVDHLNGASNGTPGCAPCLLVLDNLEHLLRDTPEAGKNDNAAQSGAPALFSRLLQRAPGLVCLATSRQPLRIGGEIEFPLPALPVPQSMRLYVDRARAARPDFALTPHNAPFVDALCRRLEGMPLAIEMAAAWVKTIPPHKMLERLERQLDLLVSRRRDLPPRHQSLRATIEWSYNLLLPELRDAFARLGVFRGGWALEAAEALCGPEALHALLALQEQSLIVSVEEEEGESRYRMLEPLREFALEKLTESDCRHEALCSHTAYFLEQAEQARLQFDGLEHTQIVAWFRAEYDNLYAALTWLRTEAPDTGTEQEIPLALALHRFLTLAGRYQETTEILRDTFERTERVGVTPMRAELATGLGSLYWMRGEYAASQQWHRTALTLLETLGDRKKMGSALNGLANTTYYQGKFAEALGYYEQALALARENNDPRMLAVALNNLGLAAGYSKEDVRAQNYLEESLALRRRIGDPRLIMAAQHNLAELYADQGRYEQAETLLAEVLTEARANGDKRQLSYTLHTLANMRTTQERYAEAAQALQESFTIRRKIGEQWGVAVTLESFGAIAFAQGSRERAVRLYSASQKVLDQIGGSYAPHVEEKVRQRIQELRDTLGSAKFQQCWEEGRHLTDPCA